MKFFTLLFITILFNSCSSTTEQKMENPEEAISENDDYIKLQDLLDQKKAAFNEKATEDKKRIYAEGIQSIIDNGIIQSSKNIGDRAPSFELKNAIGENISLESYLKKGPVILTWYRGGWCPYCNITLHRLQEELPNFKNMGANLIALTPEIPDSSLTTKEKNQLEFEILSDVGNKIAQDYGVVFKLTPEVASSYQNGFNLHAYNGDESDELPLAATYVIDQNGIIQFAFLDADYRNRAEPRDILKALKKL